MVTVGVLVIGVFICIGVERSAWDKVVFEDSLKILLAVVGEEECVYPPSKFLPVAVRRSKDGETVAADFG